MKSLLAQQRQRHAAPSGKSAYRMTPREACQGMANERSEYRQGIAEGFPVDDLIQFDQRIALVEPGIAFIQVKEYELWHRFVLIWRVMTSYIEDGYF